MWWMREVAMADLSKPTAFPCRACGKAPQEDVFLAPSNSVLGKVSWTRIECRGHPYVSVMVEGETRDEALHVWNAIMGTVKVNAEIRDVIGRTVRQAAATAVEAVSSATPLNLRAAQRAWLLSALTCGSGVVGVVLGVYLYG